MKTRFISKLTIFCLYCIGSLAFINIISLALQINILNDHFVNNLYSPEEYAVQVENNDKRVAFIGFVYSILIFSSFFIIGRWLYVSAKINHLSEISGLKITKGWAVGWYFIPIFNFFMPYRSLRETYLASFRVADWQSNNVPYYLPIWWFSWICWGILNNVSFRMTSSLGEVYSFEKLNQISYIDITSDIFLIINAFFLLKIVRKVYQNQLSEENPK